MCSTFIWFAIIQFIIVLLSKDSHEDKLWSSRNPRYLPFPKGIGNKIQIIAGFGIPVELKQDSVTFGLILKTNYALPTNSVEFSHPELAFPDVDLKMTRWTLYSLLESVLDKLSLGGRNCILRSICQAAFTSFLDSGLLGEILEILLLPSRTNEFNLQGSDYIAAEKISKQFIEEKFCEAKFPECSASLIDIITAVKSNDRTEELFNNMIESL